MPTNDKDSLKHVIAALLDGREYRDEVPRELAQRAKAENIVIIYGASDDLVEFRGAIDDELGCYSAFNNHPTRYLVDAKGIVDRDDDMSDDEVAEYVKRSKMARTITSHWGRGGYSWTYSTDIPHATFDIVEDGEKYCRGIVFSLRELTTAAEQS